MKTRAAVLRVRGGAVECLEVDAAPPGRGEVLVRMCAVGICGSDLHVVNGEWPRPLPMVLGHEGAGVVSAVGEGVQDPAVGDPVIISWAASCGECPACLSGRPARCASLRAAMGSGTTVDGTTGLSIDGEIVYRMTATGCLSDHVVVRAGAALPLSVDISMQEAALLGCAALTGVGAVRHASPLTAGMRALVVGAGGVGQFVVQGARLAGAGEIVCVDFNPTRLELARRLGATLTGHPDEVSSLVGDGVDVAFDAVGSPETTARALAHTRWGGTCVVVGMPRAGARLDLDPLDFSNREKVLTGSVYGSADPALALPQLLDDVRSGRLELGPLLGPADPLASVDEAFRASLAGATGRVMVLPNGAQVP